MIEIDDIIFDETQILYTENDWYGIKIHFKNMTEIKIEKNDENHEYLRRALNVKALKPKRRKVYAKIYHPRKAPKSQKRWR